MPNLKPPVTTVALAAAYRDRILAALPAGMKFVPLDDAVPDRQHGRRRKSMR
jgi:dihydroorotase